MKKPLIILIKCLPLAVILMFTGCFKDDAEDYNKSYNCSGSTCLGLTDYSGTYSSKTSCENACANGASACDYTEWTSSGNCNSGYVPVYTNTCCPSSSPYYNTGNNLCYSTCSEAKSANGSGRIYEANTGSGGGSGSCVFVAKQAYHKIGEDYSSYCGGSLHVTGNKCCPPSSKWYCSVTDKCYATKCDVYKACNNGNSSIYVGHNH